MKAPLFSQNMSGGAFGAPAPVGAALHRFIERLPARGQVALGRP